MNTDPIERLLDEWEENAEMHELAAREAGHCVGCETAFEVSGRGWRHRIYQMRLAVDAEEAWE